MGLLDAIYEFKGPLPSLDQLDGKICEILNEKVIREGDLGASTLSEVEAARRVASRTILMRDTRATFRTKDDLRRGARYIEVAVSLDGTKMCMVGNHHRLFKATGEALASFGGTAYVHQARSRGPGPQKSKT